MKLSITIFRNRTFLFFWLAGWLSSIGDAVFIVALTWILARDTGSPFIVGTYLFVIGTTRIVFVLFGGLVVDRFDVRKLLIAADWIRAIAMFAFMASLTYTTPPIWSFYLIGFIFGMVESVTMPGGAFVATQIVPKEQYTQSMSIFLVTENVSGIVGPLIGAALLVWSGEVFVIGVNGLSFAASALLLMAITFELPERDGSFELAAMLQDLTEGFRFFKQNRVIALLAANGFFANAAVGLSVLAMPFLALDLNVGVEGFGIIKSGIGVGGVVAGVLLSLFVIAKPTPRMVLLTSISQGVLFLLIASTGMFWVIVVGFALIGLNEAAVNVLAPSVNHVLIPRALFGRVIAVMMIVMEASEPLSQMLGGWMMERVSVQTIFFMGGTIEIVAASIIFFLPAIRNYTSPVQNINSTTSC